MTLRLLRGVSRESLEEIAVENCGDGGRSGWSLLKNALRESSRARFVGSMPGICNAFGAYSSRFLSFFLSLSESTSLTVSSVKRASNAKFFTVCRVCKLLIKCQRYHQGDCHPDAVVGCLLWVSTRHCLASCRSLVLWRYLKSYWFSNTEIWWVITDDSSGWLKWQAKCFTLRAMQADRANAIKAVCRDLREEREHLKANSKTPICMIQFVS